MANKPQTLSQGQQAEVTKILRRQVLMWSLTGLALLTGIMGVSLWQIKARVERKMESLVAAQFEESSIRQIVQNAAATQATNVMLRQIQPEVNRFKAEIAQKLAELETLVAKTKALEQQSQAHEKRIQEVLAALQKALAESQTTRDKIVGLQSDIVKMQKCAARIQYYALKGRNTFPNPYQKEMVDALNDMISIALPDPSERSKFIIEIGGPNL
jgi:septal ring factor EnvC (AmiA/AmiB activator)